ncbi:hypothetical protein FHU38_004651 [Saccharomonospora amisosensis]|uniref:Uncharacterized protein n=1 Tax=Saccharomonospora amisosensis TaxID=1128677 RepID=A0A7X5ZSV5_9PSEU|nr:hypothetical protein [Saccharomonospora amisosensis]NIJ14307.1 hypothetical protein [Saccharomonospora amisosensis]
MGLFGPRRDPGDLRQLQIAVHELGHAWVWKAHGLIIRGIEHTGSDGTCHVRHYSDTESLRAYAIGLWAGFEAEDQWLRANGLGRARRSTSSYDIRQFRRTNRELGPHSLSEAKARSLARRTVHRHWNAIEAAAPRLITKGRLSL